MKIKKRFIFLLAMLLIFSVFPFAVLAANQGVVIQSFDGLASLDGDTKVDDEIIIIYQNEGSVKDLTLRTNQIEAGDKLSDQVDLLKVSASEDIDRLILELSKNPNVLVAEKNSTMQTFAMPNDPKLDLAWQFERIGTDKTWDTIDNQDPVVVAVIDTGLNTDHPDLVGRTVEGYDFVDDSIDVSDVSGHGTNVSGCISAIANNGIGMAGVAGAANIKIAPYRIGGFSEDDPSLNVGYICAAIYQAANRPDIQVINMSFGGYGASPAVRAAVNHAAAMGKVLVAAAGNEGDHPTYGGEFAFPASYNNVISVAATDIHNEKASFSQFNPMVDLCAPGHDIYTTHFKGGYNTTSGTSFASPITAGACAVLLAADPTLTPLEVENILKETALDFSGQGRDDYYGHGLIQLDHALAKVRPSVIESYHQLKEMDRGGQVEDEIVIIYQNNGSVKDLALTSSQIQGGQVLNDQVDIIKVSDPNQVDAMVADLLKNPNVLAAERNSRLKFSALPNDPLLGEAWQFERIGADKTWDQVKNDETVGVAVLDSGLNIDHPDIVGNTLAGFDYVEDESDVIDVLGHGTSVAGCIAAVANNGIGTAGVAGLANIKIAPYRVGGETEDDAEANLGYVCAALYHAANRPEVKVINMSFVEYEESMILKTAVNYAVKVGKILVASSGNEGDKEEAGQAGVPSAYDGVISVGAIDQNNIIAKFSQYNDKVDLCAPGVKTLTLGKDNDYISPSGTSFSSPIVAGAAAVLLAADPSLSPLEVETLLKETALDLGKKGRDDYYGHGLIQLDAALAQVNPTELLRVLSFAADKLPGQKIGTEIELKASADGGTGNYDYAFSYELNGESHSIQDFSDKDTASFTPSQPGIYTFRVVIKDSDNNQAQKSLINYDIKDPMALLSYRTHVQNVGWQDFMQNGEISGTQGQSLRLEAIEIKANSIDYDIGLKYKTHVENIGWQDYVPGGALSGTQGKGLRLEAIKIELTGKDAELFDLYYQVHAQNIGWLDWGKNGDPAGTEGLGYRLEGIKIDLVLKGGEAPGEVAEPFVKK